MSQDFFRAWADPEEKQNEPQEITSLSQIFERGETSNREVEKNN